MEVNLINLDFGSWFRCLSYTQRHFILNLFNLDQVWIVITCFFDWFSNQRNSVPYYNPYLVQITKIQKRFLCVYFEIVSSWFILRLFVDMNGPFGPYLPEPKGAICRTMNRTFIGDSMTMNRTCYIWIVNYNICRSNSLTMNRALEPYNIWRYIKHWDNITFEGILNIGTI